MTNYESLLRVKPYVSNKTNAGLLLVREKLQTFKKLESLPSMSDMVPNIQTPKKAPIK